MKDSTTMMHVPTVVVDWIWMSLYLRVKATLPPTHQHTLVIRG